MTSLTWITNYLFLDLRRHIDQAWFIPLLTHWAESKQKSEDFIKQVLEWANKNGIYHKAVEDGYYQEIKQWKIWKGPRLSDTLV